MKKICLRDKWMISVLRSALPCKRSSPARNSWNKLSSQRKYSHKSLLSNAWLNHCQIILLAKLLDIFTNALSNTWAQRLSNTFLENHGSLCRLNENQLWTLRKYRSKFKCLVNKMLLIKERNPRLNLTTNFILAKLLLYKSLLTLLRLHLIMYRPFQ